MKPLNLKSINNSLIQCIETLGKARGISESQNVFLVLFTLRYLSSNIHRFHVPHECTLDSVISKGKNRVDKNLNNVMNDISRKNNDIFKNWDDYVVFESTSWKNEFEWKDLLYETITRLHDLDLESLHYEQPKIYSDSFLFILEFFSEKGEKKAGEFYSPPGVGEVIAGILSPSEGARIYDPACGSGIFLSITADHSRKSIDSKKPEKIIGQEINLSTSFIAKLNLIVHGYSDFNINSGDTLSSPKNTNEDGSFEKFDIIVSNPPFSLKNWDRQLTEPQSDPRFKFGIPPKASGDYAFLQHIIACMNDNSRAGIIVSPGALSRGGNEGKIRKAIIETNLIDSVVSLPANLFSGTGIPACILFLNKSSERNDVLFIDARKLFYSKPGSKNKISQEHIDEIIELYNMRDNIDEKSRKVILSEIRENDYNLDTSRYVSPKIDQDNESLTSLITKQKELEDELNSLQTMRDGILKGFTL